MCIVCKFYYSYLLEKFLFLPDGNILIFVNNINIGLFIVEIKLLHNNINNNNDYTNNKYNNFNYYHYYYYYYYFIEP